MKKKYLVKFNCVIGEYEHLETYIFDKKIKENKYDISQTKKKYNFNLHGYYVEEYCDILSSKAKSFEDFKKERGVI